MFDPRTTGLALMTVSTAAFVGTTSNMLPSMTFFPALVLFAVGALKFLRKNREALDVAEKRTHRALNPVIRENKHAQAHAERQAARQGVALSHSGASESAGQSAHPEAFDGLSPREFIEINDPDEDFVVATDVSFPIAVQSGDALADQLGKLNKLLEQGVLTAEEYAVAKAKILS